jgi:hypothetical protein
MAMLYSYVVDHDHGTAPCAQGRYCSLALCKYRKRRDNIVELAETGDWIVGTGGADLKRSSGHGSILYVMRVDDKLPYKIYARDKRFRLRRDVRYAHFGHGRLMLLSRTWWYFGENAIPVSALPRLFDSHPIEKRGPNFRCDFTDQMVRSFGRWIAHRFKPGVHGDPCAPLEKTMRC